MKQTVTDRHEAVMYIICNTCSITCNFHFILRINIRLFIALSDQELYGGQNQQIRDELINK